MSDFEEDPNRRQQLRAAKWKAFLWITAGCLVIGIAQCALQQL
jgi:hypothetical protein